MAHFTLVAAWSSDLITGARSRCEDVSRLECAATVFPFLPEHLRCRQTLEFALQCEERHSKSLRALAAQKRTAHSLNTASLFSISL